MAVAADRGDALGPQHRRAVEMLRRLERRLEQAGMPAEGRAPILDRLEHALRHRVAVLGSDGHFDALHPARTLLILLDDCGVTDVPLLEAAASVESEFPALRIAPASGLAAGVPTPDQAGEMLLEDLVAADHPTRLIALAERLDHARHLHLREPAGWPAFHENIGAVYSPVAVRTDQRLARRHDWWWLTFRNRFLEPAARDPAG